MTKIQETLVALPEEKKALFIPAFGDVDKFYTTVYLIARNEHVTELEKPDRYEDRLQVIRQIRGKVENLDKFYKGKTVVIVAHRLSTVKNADQIVVIDHGKVVEIGNHESLTAKRGAYYNLVKNQLELGN